MLELLSRNYWTFARIFWWRAEFIVQSIMASCPKAAKQFQIITLPVLCWCHNCWYDAFLKWNDVFIFMINVTELKRSKKFNFALVSPQNIFLKVLGIIKMWWSPVVFSLDSPTDPTFAQPPSYWWIMNSDLNGGKWGLEFFRCFSGLFWDLLDEWLMRYLCNVGMSAISGKVFEGFLAIAL